MTTVLLDVDTGIDDALAILYAVASPAGRRTPPSPSGPWLLVPSRGPSPDSVVVAPTATGTWPASTWARTAAELRAAQRP